MTIDQMGREELERIGTLLFGYSWKSRMADALEINRKTISRWIADDAVAAWAVTRLRTMANIAPPPGSSSDDDRDDACQDAIEPEVSRIVDMAVAAGWHRAEIITALLALLIADLRLRAGDPAVIEVLQQAIEAVRRQPVDADRADASTA